VSTLNLLQPASGKIIQEKHPVPFFHLTHTIRRSATVVAPENSHNAAGVSREGGWSSGGAAAHLLVRVRA
jgi:hypothetical protein